MTWRTRLDSLWETYHYVIVIRLASAWANNMHITREDRGSHVRASLNLSQYLPIHLELSIHTWAIIYPWTLVPIMHFRRSPTLMYRFHKPYTM